MTIPSDRTHRSIALGPRDVVVRRGTNDTIYLTCPHPILPYPRTLADRLAHWARERPDQVFLAKREAPGGPWRSLTYRDVFDRVERLAAGLRARKLSADRPIAILSENDLEHALLGLAAMHAGVLYAPISPAYSLVSTDFAKLKHVLGLLTPGLVFARDGSRYGRAIAACVGDDVEVVLTQGTIEGRAITRFDALEQSPSAAASIDVDSPAKLLFTSGSTGQPKGVVQTHRMLVSNQQSYIQCLPVWGTPAPVMIDWQPWHHTAGGNANFGVVLYNGGTMYIDDGKPLPGAIDATLQNLREIAPTVYVSVPRGLEMLIPHFEREPALREKFFSRLQLIWYAGAGMSAHVWESLERIGRETAGERVLVLTGLGATETGPLVTAGNWDSGRSGMIGLPAAGCDVKLVPSGDKLEIRAKGPGITPGYWRAPELTRAAFDEEGFYSLGDAVKYVTPGDPTSGLIFDGRIVEDFKLATATWVNVGVLRPQFILHCAPYVIDAAVTGHDRGFIGMLVFPNVDACRALAPELPRDAAAAAVIGHPAVRAKFQSLLDITARASTGSSNRIARIALQTRPPSLDSGELTDKGSISQRAVLAQRAQAVEALYGATPAADVIVAAK
jgi:feruloyl-CoA synthase